MCRSGYGSPQSDRVTQEKKNNELRNGSAVSCKLESTRRATNCDTAVLNSGISVEDHLTGFETDSDDRPRMRVVSALSRVVCAKRNHPLFTVTNPFCSHGKLPRCTRVDHAVVEVVHRGVRITSPSREGSSLSASTKDCKGQDEDEHLGTSIERSTDNVVVFDEQLRVATTDEPLRDKADDKEHGDTSVDADEQPTHVPQDDGHVHVLEEGMFGVAVSEPEGERYDEADEVGECDPFVPAANREQFSGHRPSYGESVEPN